MGAGATPPAPTSTDAAMDATCAGATTDAMSMAAAVIPASQLDAIHQ
jgi:hypothetical protein